MPRYKHAPQSVLVIALLAVMASLSACNDGSTAPLAHFTVGGTVSGLVDTERVTLSNNAETVTLSADGTFTFPSPVTANGSYAVTVTTQPAGQLCTVSNGSGTGVTANVSNVTVSCSTDTYTISGSVSGLAGGAQVVLQNNGADTLTISANAPFAFSAPVAQNGSYVVTVQTQPAGATCSVSNGTGAGVTRNISNISVTCSSNTYAISGSVSGMTPSSQVTLNNNGGDPLTLTSNGAFTFATQVADGGSYNVTVGTQPTGQTCTVTNGGGTNVNNNVSNVSIACSAVTYTIGGTITGLAGSTQVTLNNNGSDPLTRTVNGAFSFATPVAYHGTYSVTVGTQPNGQYCAVTSSSGTQVTANITSITVDCATNPASFTSPGSYTWTVPAGVSSISIAVKGGGGGGGGTYGTNPSASGGGGAVVSSTLQVTAGQILSFTVGGGGSKGADGPGTPMSYSCGSGGGGGGSSNLDAGGGIQIIAGGGGGGGSCNRATGGGSGSNGGGAAGSNGVSGSGNGGGSGGSGGVGGAGGVAIMFGHGAAGGNGSGGAGGGGGGNGPSLPGGAGGTSSGTGTGGTSGNDISGGGGGGYGGGGSGVSATGGGAGGSTGPVGSIYAPATNGGASATPGGNGSVVITIP